MKEMIPKNEYSFFADTARVDSLSVAEVFKKPHKEVMRGIRKLTDISSGLSEEFRVHNFTSISCKDSMGKTQKAYAVTRDGLTMLVISWGAQAKSYADKELYIKRLNERCTEKRLTKENEV